jgi:hypothetical protein
MKKSKIPSNYNYRNDNKISVIGLYCNIARAYEIAKVGEHEMSFYYYDDPEDESRTVKTWDIEKVLGFYGIKPALTGDILVEVLRPDFDSVVYSMRRKFETLEEINERVEAAKNNPIPELGTINEVCFALLKSSFERLNLGVYEVEIIMKVAQTIARMDNKNEIKVEHIAEAIQYRAIVRKDKNIKLY